MPSQARGYPKERDQPTARLVNRNSSWLRTRSQFWHLACQCFTMRREARYSILRRESSLVKLGLFFVICRNWRFSPSMIFVVYLMHDAALETAVGIHRLNGLHHAEEAVRAEQINILNSP